MTTRGGADLTDMIAGGEGATTEFKRSLTKDIGRELCAFANADGGTVLVGVSDAGRIVGVADHNRLKSRVLSTARSADPPIDVEIDSVGEILRVVVPPQKRKPYSFGGRFFMRDGATSQQMSNAEVEELFYAAGRLHFDRKPCPDFSIENALDEETWKRFSGRAKIPDAMDRMVALRNLGLLDGEDRMTYAGAWLPARDIRRFTTSAHVSCALFMGTEKVRILDRRDFHGDLPTMIDDVVAWILTKINVEFIIRRVRREERPELPEEALREAVANAVAHRDYRSTANVQIYVFKDRIEIVSPGGLPAGMTEADLGAKSMPRNPLLFGMLYRMDAVENIGSGIKRIRDLCREHGVAAPIIDVSEHWVTVTFPRPAAQSDEGTGADGRPSTSDAARKMQVSVEEAQEAQEAQDSGREAQDGAQEAQDGGDRTDSNGGRLQDWEICRAQCLCGTAGHRTGASCGEWVLDQDRQLQEGRRKAGCNGPSRTHDSRQAAQRQAAVPLDGCGVASAGRFGRREEMKSARNRFDKAGGLP